MSEFLSEMIPKLVLESMDGSVQIPLEPMGAQVDGWIRMPGSTGLEMPPVDVIRDRIPGVPGSTVVDVHVLERPIFIPIYGRSSGGQVGYRQMLDQLRSLVDPSTGSFKLVGVSVRGQRELVVTYDSGLEGADGVDTEGLSWCKVGLKVTAEDPYAQAREDRRLEFRVEVNSDPFLGAAGGSDAPWPRALANTSVIGSGMDADVYSEVPVYPKLELTGPMTSFDGSLSSVVTHADGTILTISDREWLVDIPAGVGSGATLTLVTDPRIRSIRLDGALAAGLVARGSTLRPFYPGTNKLNVVAPGGGTGTLIALSWREKFRSLW